MHVDVYYTYRTHCISTDPVQNVTRTIIDVTTVEITWAAPDVTNGIIVRYNFVVIDHDELNKELMGNDPLDVTLTTLGMCS